MAQRLLAAAVLFLGPLSLTGCGFTPLYGEHGTATEPGVVDALATVAIRSLPDREGVRLRQVLREEMQPTGLTKPVYDLEITFAKRIEELGIRPDATSSRANLVFSASFKLNQGGKAVYADSVQSIVSYNILDDQYATVASQADAETRGIKEVGEGIKTRLAVYFHERLKDTKVADAAGR